MAIKDFDVLMEPVVGGGYRDVSVLSDVNLAFQQVQGILYTAEGEVPFDPDFGGPYSLFETYAGYQLPSIFPIAAAAVETDLRYARNVRIWRVSQNEFEVVATVQFDYNRQRTLSKGLEMQIAIPILDG